MLLTVIAQNSIITFGVFGGDDNDDQREYWTISTHPLRTVDELSLVVHQLLRSTRTTSTASLLRRLCRT